MAKRKHDPTHLILSSGGGHVFRGPARLVRTPHEPGRYDAFIVILSGVFRSEWEEQGKRMRLEAGPGEVVFRAGEREWVESSEPSAPLVAVSLYFEWGNRRGMGEVPMKVVDRDGLMGTLAQAILANQDSRSGRRLLIENGFLTGVVAEYLRLGEQEGTDLGGQLTQYVYMNVRAPITLADLAEYVEMSPRRLQRECKKLMGMTPMQLVRRVRTEGAIRMLMQSPTRTLKDAAMRMGFANAQELCARVKKHTGVTVGELRARKKGPGAGV